MLVASSVAVLAESRLTTAVFIERRFRLYSAWRERLLFDTAHAAGPRKPTNAVTLLFILDGRAQVRGELPRAAPTAFVLDETEYERIKPGALTLRTWGEPYVSFELRVPRVEVMPGVPVGLKHGPLALSETTWQTGFRLADAIALQDLSPEPLRAFLAALEQEGLVVRGLSTSIQREEAHIDRLWGALAPYYQKQATATTLLHVKKVLGLSLRQLQRDMTELIRTFELFGDGFRETQKVLRLRAALLWASSPEATLAEIAEHVGYSSVDAMTRAFRDAKLSPPSMLRELVRYTG
ncbi:MAG: AraC family transcriptional regulator [Kofleriaceae bacterium]|nr:AraC family transcriptional regulator [Kofleriaceae bacterium]